MFIVTFPIPFIVVSTSCKNKLIYDDIINLRRCISEKVFVRVTAYHQNCFVFCSSRQRGVDNEPIVLFNENIKEMEMTISAALVYIECHYTYITFDWTVINSTEVSYILICEPFLTLQILIHQNTYSNFNVQEKLSKVQQLVCTYCWVVPRFLRPKT